MPSTGFVLPNSGANDTLASTAWVNPGNITADDGTLAEESITAKNTPATANDGADTNGFLQCSYLASQFTSLPADSTITQVNLRAEWGLTAAGSGIGILDVRWRVDATTRGALNTNSAEPAVGTVDTYNVTATRSWVPNDFKSGNFRIQVRGRNGNNAGNPGYRFDFVAVEVVYAEAQAITGGVFSQAPTFYAGEISGEAEIGLPILVTAPQRIP